VVRTAGKVEKTLNNTYLLSECSVLINGCVLGNYCSSLPFIVNQFDIQKCCVIFICAAILFKNLHNRENQKISD
jgi:hypothetical protein